MSHERMLDRLLWMLKKSAQSPPSSALENHWGAINGYTCSHYLTLTEEQEGPRRYTVTASLGGSCLFT